MNMRWKRKLAITVLAAAASAIGGSEIAKKRFSNGKGSAYRKFLDKVIRYNNRMEDHTAEEPKAEGPAAIESASDAQTVNVPTEELED